MTVTIRLPRFASSDYSLEDRQTLVRYLQPLLARTIAGVRVEQRTDRGLVITAGYDGGPEAGAIAAAAAVLDLIDQALTRDVQARGARRQLALIVYAQTRRATITVEV
jgi:hypothetical protein